jgi:hypothetical protein
VPQQLNTELEVAMNIEIPKIPHGHGLSFKKGLSDALLETKEHQESCHETHLASYRSGYEIGESLKTAIAKKVKA